MYMLYIFLPRPTTMPRNIALIQQKCLVKMAEEIRKNENNNQEEGLVCCMKNFCSKK